MEQCGRLQTLGRLAKRGGFRREEADEVNVYDFPSDALYRASPYGIYDPARNEGHVCVGISSDTPQFAVDAIRGWFRSKGRRRYGDVDQLLIELEHLANTYQKQLTTVIEDELVVAADLLDCTSALHQTEEYGMALSAQASAAGTSTISSALTIRESRSISFEIRYLSIGNG